MKFAINETEYQLEFGLGFIRELDKAYTIKGQGMEFGMGVETAVSYLAMENPTVLYEIIKAGTAHLKSKPSNVDIENELAKLAEEGKLEKTFVDFQEAMEEAPFLKSKIKRFKEKAKVVQEEQEE